MTDFHPEHYYTAAEFWFGLVCTCTEVLSLTSLLVCCTTGLAVAPDKTAVVSVGSEGGIFIWEYAQPNTAEACNDDGTLHELQHLSVQ